MLFPSHDEVHDFILHEKSHLLVLLLVSFRADPMDGGSVHVGLIPSEIPIRSLNFLPHPAEGLKQVLFRFAGLHHKSDERQADVGKIHFLTLFHLLIEGFALKHPVQATYGEKDLPLHRILPALQSFHHFLEPGFILESTLHLALHPFRHFLPSRASREGTERAGLNLFGKVRPIVDGNNQESVVRNTVCKLGLGRKSEKDSKKIEGA